LKDGADQWTYKIRSMKKKRLPRKLKKKWKKMGIVPIFKVEIPKLSDSDRDRIIKAWGKFQKEPLKLKSYDQNKEV